MTTPTPFVEVNDLHVSYPGGNLALDGVDLQVGAGEFVAILGPSGCGKSTLLQVLSGLLAPASGSASIGGVDVSSAEARALRVGYVFQDHRLLPWCTVRQNIELVLKAAAVPKAEWEERIDTFLTMLKVAQFKDSWPLRLSGGQRQRVSIARALAVRPELLMMDEPFSTLDEVTARKMRQQISGLWEQNPYPVIFVTHSIREAVYLADRILILTKGPGRVLEEYVVPVARPRRYEDPALAAAEDEIVRRVLDVWEDEKTLEEAG